MYNCAKCVKLGLETAVLDKTLPGCFIKDRKVLARPMGAYKDEENKKIPFRSAWVGADGYKF